VAHESNIHNWVEGISEIFNPNGNGLPENAKV